MAFSLADKSINYLGGVCVWAGFVLTLTHNSSCQF